MISKNDKIVLALIGAGGRGTQVVLEMCRDNPGLEVKYVCDVDEERGGRAINELEKRQGFRPERVVEMRRTFDDKDVDAVLICTPEHWHGLATIRACQAGKDVYVEKNISLTMMEGRKMIEAADKYKRVIQCGTQNRSAPYAFSARDYIMSGKLGKIVMVKTFCMLPGRRPWAPKEDEPVPEGLNWDLWLGPAQLVPYNLSRHKSWNSWWAYSGGQSLAGDASHVMDLARMVLGDPRHPRSIFCAGGRVLNDDDREVPDNQTITFDYGSYPLTCESSYYGDYMSKSPPEVRFADKFPDWALNSTRIEIYGTEGLMFLGRHGGGWQVFGDDFRVIAEDHGYFPDKVHQKDFVDCIRSRSVPNGNIRQGHYSAALVNMANISYRVGKKQLLLDGDTEIYIDSEEANAIENRSYRKGFEIPDKI
jgi:predicted dehydrogenase